MNKIRKYRLLAGMTQKDLAEAVGVHHTIISDWEIGKKAPRGNKLPFLTKALNADYRELFPNSAPLKATHFGKLKINERELDCAVLEDGTRILSQTAVFQAFGRKQRGFRGDRVFEGTQIKVPSFMDANNLKPFIHEGLIGKIKPIAFYNEKNVLNEGYDATILNEVCEVYLKARDAGVLKVGQQPVAIASDILVRSLAKIGVIALVDEATGYQKYRDRRALQTILEEFIAKELQPWLKTFPDEYYEEMFRLKEWESPVGRNKPGIVGKYTNDLIYKRLAPGVLEELQKQNPKNEKGNRLGRHHQHLTPETGHPKLKEHISIIVAFMRASQNWNQFQTLVNRSLPVYENRQLEFELDLDLEGSD